MISFSRPWAFAFLLLPAAALWLRHRKRRADREVVEVPDLPRARTSAAALLWPLPWALSCLGVIAAAAALAGPRRFERRPVDPGWGANIAIALDVSGSMSAEDFQPRNRLEVARSVVADFIRGRKTDSMALLEFSGAARTVCPSTDDRDTLLALLARADGSKLPDGTAIGNAIATSVSRLKDLPGKSKVLVLVTDGGNNSGQIDPETAAGLARAYGIRIHTIAVGRGGRVPITISSRDPSTGKTVRRRIEADVEVDEPLLRKISAATGGRSFRATDSAALASIFHEIDSLEKSPVPPGFEILARDLSAYPARAAAALLLTALLLSAGPLRVETEA
ncbi:MAG: VWA domain-containing protein [Thermoanaerobaculia bacterium]